MHSQLTQSRERGRETNNYLTYPVTETRYPLLNKQCGVPFVSTDMRRHLRRKETDGRVFLRLNFTGISLK